MLVTPVTSLSGEMTGNITSETKRTVILKNCMTAGLRRGVLTRAHARGYVCVCVCVYVFVCVCACMCVRA